MSCDATLAVSGPIPFKYSTSRTRLTVSASSQQVPCPSCTSFSWQWGHRLPRKEKAEQERQPRQRMWPQLARRTRDRAVSHTGKPMSVSPLQIRQTSFVDSSTTGATEISYRKSNMARIFRTACRSVASGDLRLVKCSVGPDVFGVANGVEWMCLTIL